MRQWQHALTIETSGAGLYEFTDRLRAQIAASGMQSGLATIFCRHTSASVLIQENADPDVQTDLRQFFERLVPEGMAWIVHDAEGPDDMPAHIKSALTQTSLGVPFAAGAPLLGTWQGVFLFEHRRRPHRRTVIVQLIGD